MFEWLIAAVTLPGLRVPGVSDAELVERFKGGDRRAFDQIVHRYQDRVYTLCRRWLGHPEGAEEITQEVFIALVRSLPTFRGDARLSTYVFKVTLNHCRNHRLYRQRRAWGRHEALGPRPDDDDRPEVQVADEAARTDAPLHASEAQALLVEGLGALDDDHRQILLLRDVEDLSYEEIGEILELPGGTVRSRIHRARQELAGFLARRVRREDVV